MFLASLLLVTLGCSKTPSPTPPLHTLPGICFNPFLSMFLFFWEAQGNYSTLLCVFVCNQEGQGWRVQEGIRNHREDGWYPTYSVCVCVCERERERERDFCQTNKTFIPKDWHVTLPCFFLTSLVAQMVKNLPAMRETWVWSLGWENSLDEGMACLVLGSPRAMLSEYPALNV